MAHRAQALNGDGAAAWTATYQAVFERTATELIRLEG